MSAGDDRKRTYIAIDLKSFYASVECAQRDYDPLDTNLVVADESRTEKTICLAVSPSLKEWGIPGRPRLFEVIERVKEINNARLIKAPGRRFTGESCFKSELDRDPSLKLSFITAVPRMSLYMKCSSDIYKIYMQYASSEDIHVYSVDEVFIDVTEYLKLHGMTPHDLTIRMIREVLKKTGVTATAGIGTNLYLAKIAMDIVAKHMEADADGVRIAELDEESYRRELWTHEPLRDFWRVGNGYVKRLKEAGIYTMGDIARCSVENEDILYKMFGINAELLIDHAWGYEPCTIEDIRGYKSENNSMGEGQVLKEPYTFDMAKTVMREMADKLALKLMERGLVTDQMVLNVGYDVRNLKEPDKYRGEVKTDWYGRQVPKGAHGSENIGEFTMIADVIINCTMKLFDRIVDPGLFVRRMSISANHVKPESETEAAGLEKKGEYEQMELFSLMSSEDKQRKEEEEQRAVREAEKLKKEKSVQEAVLSIKKKYGNNAILKGTSFKEGATLIERNEQIGGHKA